MQVKKRKLPGTLEIQLKPFRDDRGFFMRTFDRQTFEEHGIQRDWVQENHALSVRKGTLRGLHLQLPPYAETKLVRCLQGAVLDVFVDLRADSPTFGQWDSVELSAEAKNMVYIPREFAHGYLSLTDDAEISYKVDSIYQPDYERAIRWNDPALAIDWGIDHPIVSDKDQRAPSLEEFLKKHHINHV